MAVRSPTTSTTTCRTSCCSGGGGRQRQRRLGYPSVRGVERASCSGGFCASCVSMRVRHRWLAASRLRVRVRASLGRLPSCAQRLRKRKTRKVETQNGITPAHVRGRTGKLSPTHRMRCWRVPARHVRQSRAAQRRGTRSAQSCVALRASSGVEGRGRGGGESRLLTWRLHHSRPAFSPRAASSRRPDGLTLSSNWTPSPTLPPTGLR